jgi:TraX protein
VFVHDRSFLRVPVTRVTTIDAWKLVGIASLLVDHYGLFFVADDGWWRVAGRVAAPIFFFLIGFGRTQRVPPSWLAWGALLTAVDYLMDGDGGLQANILVNFALVRLALPYVERQVMGYPLRLVALVGISAALISLLDPVLEYGSEGWLWALFGLSHGLLLERSSTAAALREYALAGVAAGVYVLREVSDYDFALIQALVLALSSAG